METTKVEHVIWEENMLAMYDLKSTPTDMDGEIYSFNSGVGIHGLRGKTISMLIRQMNINPFIMNVTYWRSMQKYEGADITSMVTLP
ncbi:hypothetical protein Tco_0819712, partial [Tanacetum coccineum]